MNHSFEDLHKLSNLKGKLNDLYSNLAIRLFSFSLLGVFLPIYLLSRGWMFIDVAYFFAIFFAMMALCSLFSVSFIRRFGVKNSVGLSLVLSIVFFYLLYMMGQGMWVSPIVIAFFGAVAESLYFSAVNIDFALKADRAHKVENIGALDSFFKSSALFSPVIGAWVIMSEGFELLFGVVIVGLIVALIGAFELKGFRQKFKFQLDLMFVSENVRHFLVFVAYGALSVGEWLLWPVFVYMLTWDVCVVALAVAFSALGNAVFVALFRRVSLGRSLASFVRVGALVYCLSWVLRAFATNEIEIYVLSFLAGLVMVLVNVPLFTDTFERVKTKGALGFLGFREVAVCMGRVLMLLVVIVGIGYGVSWVDLGYLGLALFSLVFLWFE